MDGYSWTHLDFNWLRVIDKLAAYAFAYGNDKPLLTAIDEDGCGAVFAAAEYNGEWK